MTGNKLHSKVNFPDLREKKTWNHILLLFVWSIWEGMKTMLDELCLGCDSSEKEKVHFSDQALNRN